MTERRLVSAAGYKARLRATVDGNLAQTREGVIHVPTGMWVITKDAFPVPIDYLKKFGGWGWFDQLPFGTYPLSRSDGKDRVQALKAYIDAYNDPHHGRATGVS